MKVSFKIELYIQYFSLHIPEELSSRAWKPRRKPNLHINQTPKNSELNVKIMVSTIYMLLYQYHMIGCTIIIF